MNEQFTAFAAQWLRVVILTLVPVVLTAFLTIPMNLGRHPGDPVATHASLDRHMT